MKIVATSDLHGELPDIPECDLLIIAGDVCPGPYFPKLTYMQMHVDWLTNEFAPWLAKQKNVVGIAGNHDSVLEAMKLDLPWTYLQDSGMEFGGLHIWGTPWSHPFEDSWPYEWAFMANADKQRERFSLIPANTDILITHAPPYGVMDMALDGRRYGSPELLRRIEGLPNLCLNIFGHIHEAAGSMKLDYRDLAFANVSYRLVKQLLIAEFPDQEK